MNIVQTIAASALAALWLKLAGLGWIVFYL